MEKALLIALAIVVSIIIVILLIVKNRKDEKQFEDQLKQDYHKPKPHDAETEGTDKI